jgi:tetratricopeptide (TPR) repeat protein
MSDRFLRIALSILFAALPMYGQELASVPPTTRQDSLFHVAIRQYDEGHYDQAVSTYTSVLDQNPDFVPAIAELSLTHTAMRKYDLAAATAIRGLAYKSGFRRDLYLNLGTAYDMLGKTDDAIAAYRHGLDLDPEGYLMHYNLGLTFMRANEVDSARIHLHSALRSNPSHASSHMALGQLYESLGKRVPSLFAFARFLILEPTSARSAVAAVALRRLLADSMSVRPTGPGQMTISISPDSDSIDGDVTSLALSLAMTQTARVTKDSSYSSPLASIASDLSSFFQITSEILENEHASGFIWSYYAPYFAALQRQGFTDIVTRVMFRSTHKAEVLPFLESRRDEVKNFSAWSSSYKWGK